MTYIVFDDEEEDVHVRLGSTRPRIGPTARRADLDISLDEISPGRCVFTTCVGNTFRPPDSLTNGGPCATLADFAMAAAIQSTLSPGCHYTVLRFTIVLTRVETPPRGLLQATGEALDLGGGNRSASASVVDARGLMRAQAALVARVCERSADTRLQAG